MIYPLYPLNRRLGGLSPEAGMDAEAKRKKFRLRPCRELNLGRPARMNGNFVDEFLVTTT